jgi:hypothetical protein
MAQKLLLNCETRQSGKLNIVHFFKETTQMIRLSKIIPLKVLRVDIWQLIREKMRLKILITCLLFLCFSTTADAGVLFSEDFDGQSDWTITQHDKGTSDYISEWDGSNVPSGWTSYWLESSHCSSPGYNSMYVDQYAGYPEDTESSRGGSGKCLTFWDESCYAGWESEAMLGVDLGQEYSEIYVRFYIKLGYQVDDDPYETRSEVQHKLGWVSHWDGNVNPYLGFATAEETQPKAVNGWSTSQDALDYYNAPRCFCGNGGGTDCYYCGDGAYSGTPEYDYTPWCCADQIDFAADLAAWLNDQEWHCMEFRWKMNTYGGSSFNSDGIHQFWLDGVLKGTWSAIPYNMDGAPTSPVRGFRHVGFGGNNNNRWTDSCSGTGCEQWWAIDDIVVSTEYIGPIQGPPAPPQDLPEIELSATSYHYGSVEVGNSSEWTLTISNQGTEILTVSSVASDNPDFIIVSPTFPRDINAGASIDVVVRFSPSSAIAISGNLTIDSNDPDEASLSVSLSGTGIEEIEDVCIYFEAESGTLSSPMIIGNDPDPTGFGGGYVYAPAGSGDTNNPTVEAVYNIDIPYAGDYYLWLRMHGPAPANDAIYIGFNGNFDRVYPSQWVDYDWVKVGTVHTLSAGTNQINIGHGEELARADTILVTDDPGLIPSGVPADTDPPSDVTGFTATPSVGQVSLSWTNPTDSDFAGVMIRYRTDGTYPTSNTDGTAVPNNGGKIPGQPSTPGSYVHTGLDYNLTYCYSAFSYDTSENYSDTAHASAKPLPPPNQAPVIGEFKAIPSSLNNPGESTTFNVSATDPDGDSLTYTIDFGDGTPNGTGSQVVHTYETQGTYTAEVSVDDGHGHTVAESIQVIVNNILPVKPTGVSSN